MKRKIATWIILFMLLVVPFINWRLGALFWLCAWFMFIAQGLFGGKSSVVSGDEEEGADAFPNADQNSDEDRGRDAGARFLEK